MTSNAQSCCSKVRAKERQTINADGVLFRLELPQIGLKRSKTTNKFMFIAKPPRSMFFPQDKKLQAAFEVVVPTLIFRAIFLTYNGRAR